MQKLLTYLHSSWTCARLYVSHCVSYARQTRAHRQRCRDGGFEWTLGHGWGDAVQNAAERQVPAPLTIKSSGSPRIELLPRRRRKVFCGTCEDHNYEDCPDCP